MTLRGKVVLVTGASRGLGESLARETARRGARVVLVARDPRPLDDVTHAIRAEGGDAWSIAADVADKDANFA